MVDTWIKEVAENYLNFSTNEWDICMNDHSKGKHNGNAVDDFLGSLTNKGTALLIYTLKTEEVNEIKTKRKREVPIEQQTIITDNSNNNENTVVPPTTEATDIPTVTEINDTAIQESKEKEAAEGVNPEGEVSTTTDAPAPEAVSNEDASVTEEKKDEEPPAEVEQPKFRIIEEEIIERVVTVKTLLQASIGTLPQGVFGVTAVYFVKTKDGALSPPGDVNEYMADVIEYGSIAPDMLNSIEALLRFVYTPCLEPQLGGKGGSNDNNDGNNNIDGENREDDQSQSLGSPPTTANGTPGVGGLNGATLGKGRTLKQNVSSSGSVLTTSQNGMATTLGGNNANVHRQFPAPDSEDKDLVGVADSVRGEFKSALGRFSIIVSQTIQQLSSDIRITLPNITVQDPEAASEDQDIIAKIIEAMESWNITIATVCAPVTENDKGSRPLQEVEFWRGRNARLSTVYDALQQPTVKTLINVLEIAREPSLEVFKGNFTLLSHATVEARDNVKFLNTLERHFKNLSTGSLNTVADTLPSLLNGLRMVWTISRHYNTDDTMLPLMKRIVNELADKVASEVNVKYILRLARTDPAEAITTMTSACAVLDGWRNTYLAVRERIERSTDHRWEFDRRVLFERTDHMSAIINDLLRIVTVTSEYAKFFRGNELKAITNDPAALTTITKLVNRLTTPLTRLHYSVYDKAKHSKWRSEIATFDEKVAEIDRRTEAFIQSAFAHLRSAEGAFDLLAKFEKMEMRDSIRALMEANMSNIINKARGELAAAAALFEAQKENPPLTKNSPPVAGAIAWANALYLRQKRPIVKFRTVPALFVSENGQALKAEYLTFARSVDAYIKNLYTAWCEEAKKSAAELLRQPILGPGLLKDPLSAASILAMMESDTKKATEKKHDHEHKDGEHTGNASKDPKPEHDVVSEMDPKTVKSLRRAAAATAAAVAAFPALASDKEATRIPPPPYHVNLSRTLLTLIREAKLLDRMGYAVPEAAMSAALQEDSLNDYTARLQAMLDRYHGALSALTPVEANLLQVQLARLRIALRPGFTPLNWNSLHVSAYIADVGTALQDFDSVLSQVRKSCGMLEDAVNTIETSLLLDASEFDGREGLDVSEVVDIIDRQRAARLDTLVRKHKSIKPVMQQIEGIIAGTDTCASPALAEFYRYWERRFYNAITHMILSSMATFEALLNAVSPPVGSGVAPYKRAPLCRVKASYAAPDFILSPDLNYITKFLRRAVHNLINSAKSFTRWMDGTCLEVEVNVPPGEQQPDF